MQRTRRRIAPPGLHVGLIMDGNGRWAEAHGLPRVEGHRVGAQAATSVVEAAPGCGIGTLTLFAFSGDNWRRPVPEVAALMTLAAAFLREQAARAVREGVRINVIGRRDRLPATVRHAALVAERATRAGERLLLRIALDYSARDAIVRAAHRLPPGGATHARFAELVAAVDHGESVPPVDLLVRTGGECRLSDFLLWECAYAELRFLDLPWPASGPVDLADAVTWFRRRSRRFGGLDPIAHPQSSHEVAS